MKLIGDVPNLDHLTHVQHIITCRSHERLLLNEDGTTQSRLVMDAKGRDGRVWRLRLRKGPWKSRVDVSSATRIAELDPPGRDGVPVKRGMWETSGILDGSPLDDDET